jgi:hypothetical protein
MIICVLKKETCNFGTAQQGAHKGLVTYGFSENLDAEGEAGSVCLYEKKNVARFDKPMFQVMPDQPGLITPQKYRVVAR